MKRTYEERLLAVQKCLGGATKESVSRELGIDDHDVAEWLARYEADGQQGLLKQPKKLANLSEKCKIVCEFAEKGVPLYRVCAKYHVSRGSVQRWTRMYRKGGYDALRTIKKLRKSKKVMGRPKKKPPQTELERLRYENEYLRAEVALLKKVRALMEEKETQLHEIGRKPSKH